MYFFILQIYEKPRGFASVTVPKCNRISQGLPIPAPGKSVRRGSDTTDRRHPGCRAVPAIGQRDFLSSLSAGSATISPSPHAAVSGSRSVKNDENPSTAVGRPPRCPTRLYPALRIVSDRSRTTASRNAGRTPPQSGRRLRLRRSAATGNLRRP